MALIEACGYKQTQMIDLPSEPYAVWNVLGCEISSTLHKLTDIC